MFLVCYRVTMRLWKENSSGPVHALELGYSLGGLLCPKLAEPFLDERFSRGYHISHQENSQCNSSEASLMQDSFNSSSISEYTHLSKSTPMYPARFVAAYWIIAALSFLTGASILVCHIYDKLNGIRIDVDDGNINDISSSTTTWRERFRLRSCSSQHPRLALGIITLLSLQFGMSLPFLRATSKFLFSYARGFLCMSVRDSSTLNSVYFIAVAIARLCAFLMSPLLHVKYMLQVSYSFRTYT